MNVVLLKRNETYIVSFVLLVALIAFFQIRDGRSVDGTIGFSEQGFQLPGPVLNDRTPLPVNEPSGEKVPAEWLERIHKAAPGDDWQAIEANSIRQLLAAKQARTAGGVFGDWVERGPSNIPGRIVDIEIDYTNGYMYAQSDHGIIFRADDFEGTNWVALNDQHPLGLDVSSQLEVFDDGNMVSSGWIKVDNYWGVYHSGDGGNTWNKSTGFSGLELTGIKRMLRQNDTVFVFKQEYDPGLPSDYYTVYKSIDKGNSFMPFYQSAIPVGDGGRHRKSDMWVSNDPQDPNVYLMLEDSLFLVDKTTGFRTFNSLISNLPVEQGLLTGLTTNGVTELRAYIASGGIGKFYAWNSIDQTWSFNGEMTDWWLALPFGFNSFTCSKQSADVLYFGGILTSKSTDGGTTWTTMDLDPTGSFALYHGDVPKTFTTINPDTNAEEVYLGTDGGIYKMDENEHFNSISIPGLNCTQIYKMASRQASPGEMFIGTQDNGYSHTNLGDVQTETVDFTFQWGGDVTNVASGDEGETFWLWWLGDGCNYMEGPDEVVSTWSPYDLNGSIPYWEPPVWIPEQYPDRCYTAGFLNDIPGNYIIELQANPGTGAGATQFDYNFESEIGGKISAIAISPLDFNYFYVATENGYFLSSTDGGSTWSSTLLSNSMYPRAILPSNSNLGEVWVGGTGYSNSPIFHSTDNGQSFTALDAGMPSCRVDAFAANEDESMLFAATSIGPFAYDQSELSWADISDTEAPIVQYMDVEFLTAANTARFATYARGVWDFQLETTSSSSLVSTPGDVKVYPNPASNFITVETGPNLLKIPYQIINYSGVPVRTGILNSARTQIDIADLPTGVYFITIVKGNNNPAKLIIQ